MGRRGDRGHPTAGLRLVANWREGDKPPRPALRGWFAVREVATGGRVLCRTPLQAPHCCPLPRAPLSPRVNPPQPLQTHTHTHWQGRGTPDPPLPPGAVPAGAGLGTAPSLGWPCHLLAGPRTARRGPGHSPMGDGDRTLCPSPGLPDPVVSFSSLPPLPSPHQPSNATPVCAVTPGTISRYHQSSVGTTIHHWEPLDITRYHWTPTGTNIHHWVLLDITRYYQSSLGTTFYHRVPSGITGYPQPSLCHQHC